MKPQESFESAKSSLLGLYSDLTESLKEIKDHLKEEDLPEYKYLVEAIQLISGLIKSDFGIDPEAGAVVPMSGIGKAVSSVIALRIKYGIPPEVIEYSPHPI